MILLLLSLLQGLSYQFPCAYDPALMCESFEMKIGQGTSAFIDQKFKNAKDNAMCEGRFQKGTIRYFTNGTAPSSIIGTLAPQILQPGESPVDSTGTLEPEGNVIILYSKKDILGFKATQANWGEAVMSWECSL